ncbi:MAG: antA/AntB antirepressor family protein [Shewanella xiamenensis]|nr:antA/AntB antirepressor family protein [Shewanella xiamenensis]
MFEISTSKVKFNDEIINAVNARELHSWLESKQDFSTWIKKRIKQCQFIENIDFDSAPSKSGAGIRCKT